MSYATRNECLLFWFRIMIVLSSSMIASTLFMWNEFGLGILRQQGYL